MPALPRDGLDPAAAERRLRDYLGVATLDAFGGFHARRDRPAAGTALAYVRTHPDRFALRRLQPAGAGPAHATPGDRCRDPGQPWKSPVRSPGSVRGSLLATIDRTVRRAGPGCWPSVSPDPRPISAVIGRRLDALAFFERDAVLRERLRGLLAGAPDMTRALSRLALERGGPRDLAAIRDGLTAARAACALLDGRRDGGVATA